MIQWFDFIPESDDTGDVNDWHRSSTLGLIGINWRFPAPDVKTNVIDIPGANGVLDLSEALTGYPVFENTKGEISFFIPEPTQNSISEIYKMMHGRRMRLRYDGDPTHYREGRMTITEDSRADILRRITCNVDAAPYRYSISESTQSVPITPNVIIDNATWNVGENASGGRHSDLNEWTIGSKSFTVSESGAYSGSRNVHVSIHFAAPAGHFIFTAHMACTANILPYDSNRAYPGRAYLRRDGLPTVTATLDGTEIYSVSVPAWSGDNSEMLLTFHGYSQAGGTVKLDFDCDVWGAGNESVTTISEKSLITLSEIYLLHTNLSTLSIGGNAPASPQLIATQDCIVNIDGKDYEVTANTPFKLRDINAGGSAIFAHGATAGAVNIKWREGVI